MEQVVDIDDKTCPCCAGALHKIGEDVAERLDVILTQFRVLVVRRPKYACRTCQEVVVQAPAPAHRIGEDVPSSWTSSGPVPGAGGAAPRYACRACQEVVVQGPAPAAS